MPWKPSEPGEVPTLGWGVIDWIETYLAHPGFSDIRTWKLYREFEDFILRFYALDATALNPVYPQHTGRRQVRRGLLGRPRGWAKSPCLAALMLCESMGPVVPAGWDANGQPVGAPWTDTVTFLGHITAVSEEQTDNTWAPLMRMCDGPVADEYGVQAMETFVIVPDGKIESRTSAGRSIKGAPTQFAVLDQTEEWVTSNGGIKLANIIRDNVAKMAGSSIESPNAFIPGDKSVAEASAAYAQDIAAGRSLNKDGLLWDHREAGPETDLYERESVTLGLRLAYGDASNHPDGCLLHDPPCAPGHADIEARISRIWEPDYDPQDARANFLNQITHASTSWIDQPSWAGRYSDRQEPPVLPIADGEVITLGFDGSRGRFKGKPDGTALIGCRLADGHVFEVGVWEAADQDTKAAPWKDWSPPITEIENELGRCFTRYRVAAFYADPAKDWRSHVNAWEAKYGPKTVKTPDGKQVHVSRDHPFEWWMTGGRTGLVQRAIEQMEGAIRNGDMTHDGSYSLTRHVLNARRRFRAGKLSLSKEHDYSPKKIDGAIAAILAWQARLDCLAAGIQPVQPKPVIPTRLR